jgi:hypothetical protein
VGISFVFAINVFDQDGDFHWVSPRFVFMSL